jgi:hypothetical protein
MTAMVLVVDDELDVETLFRQQFRREARCCTDPVLVAGEWAGTHIGRPIHLPRNRRLAVQIPAEHRHRIPKARYRVTNWSEYNASLGQRGRGAA